jgi:hypothetical protein
MIHTRREFIKRVGLAIASLVMAQCTSFSGKGDSPRDRVRHCWSRLDWLAQKALDYEHYEAGEKARDELVAEHRAALDDLVVAGELDVAVADQMQVAFSEAAFHAWRDNAPITCYIALPIEYGPRSDLLKQAELLESASDLDPAVVEGVQAAIARDITFFEVAAGPAPGYELLDQLEAGEIEASPEAIEAARTLVSWILGGAE